MLLMGAAAFGTDRGSLRRTGVFVLLSFALGGTAMLLRREDFFAPIGAAAVVWLLCRVGLDGRIGGRELVEVRIFGGNVPVHLTALRDTGNALRDPITGTGILVVDMRAARELTGLSDALLRDPVTAVKQQAIPGLHLVPFRAVGSSSSLLLAKKYDVKIGNVRGPRLVAFAPDGLGGGDYRALTGGVV